MLKTKNVVHTNIKRPSHLWSMIEGLEESEAAVLEALQLLSDQCIPSHVSGTVQKNSLSNSQKTNNRRVSAN